MANNFLKRFFCLHDYYTVTNLYGDAINYAASIFDGNRVIRSIQQCKNCGKIKRSEFLDKNCKVINYNIYHNNGKFKYIER